MQIVYWVTNECNLSCSYCYVGDKGIDYMTNEIIDQSLVFIQEQLEANNDEVLMVRFHGGGEPMLNHHLIKYVCNQIRMKCWDVRLYFEVTTNGTIDSEEVMAVFFDNIDEVSISLDGTKDIHDRYRIDQKGKGSYDRAIATALKLKETMGSEAIRIRMTFDADTVYYLAEGVIHLAELGFSTIVPAADSFDKRWSNETVSIYEHECSKIKRYIENKNYHHRSEKLCVAGFDISEVRKKKLPVMEA